MSSFIQVIPTWPADGASDVVSLLRRAEDDPGSLTEVERTVLGWLREAERVSGQRPITSPTVLREMLTFPDGKAKSRGTIKVPVEKWVTIPLDENYHRILDPSKGAGRHWRMHVTSGPPTSADLHDVPAGGRFIIIAGGSPEDMLSQAHVEALSFLCNERPVGDVLFWHTPAGQYPTMWSARRKSGCTFSAGSWVAEEFPTSTPPQLMEMRLR